MKEESCRVNYSGYAPLFIRDFNHVFLLIRSRRLRLSNITFCGEIGECSKDVLKGLF
jgi:hypothetical protein